MNKNKVITAVLCCLFIISFCLGVVGYMNRGKQETPSTPDTPTPNNNTPTDLEDVVVYNGDVKNIITLNNVIGNVEFVKANKENSNGFVKAVIENGKVVVSVDPAAYETPTQVTEDTTQTQTETTTPVEETNTLEPAPVEPKTYEITDVDNSVAVQVIMDSTTKTKVYIMDNNNKLYASVFYASPASHTGIETKEYKVDGIESFIALNTPLDDSLEQIYVVIKTMNNEYYSDYDFAHTGDTILTKLTNDEQPVTIEEVQLSSKKDNIEKVALSYVQANNILTTDGSVKVYVYKLVEAGLIETDKGATSEECLKDKHNTSLGCVLDKKENGKSLNSNYVTVTKTGNDYKTAYVTE